MKDMYRLLMWLPRWFLRNVSDLSTAWTGRATVSVYNSAGLVRKADVVYIELTFYLYGSGLRLYAS